MGSFHVGEPHLGQYRPVVQLDHRMDDALRMDDHLDLIRRAAEQPGSLDHLQALVHHLSLNRS
jgi:hypothetical protein